MLSVGESKGYFFGFMELPAVAWYSAYLCGHYLYASYIITYTQDTIFYHE